MVAKDYQEIALIEFQWSQPFIYTKADSLSIFNHWQMFAFLFMNQDLVMSIPVFGDFIEDGVGLRTWSFTGTVDL